MHVTIFQTHGDKKEMYEVKRVKRANTEPPTMEENGKETR